MYIYVYRCIYKRSTCLDRHIFMYICISASAFFSTHMYILLHTYVKIHIIFKSIYILFKTHRVIASIRECPTSIFA